MLPSDLRWVSWSIAGAALVAGWIALFDGIPLQRAWGVGALVVYGTAAVLMMALSGSGDRIRGSVLTKLTWTVICLVVLGVTVVPLLRLAWARTHGWRGPSIQSEALMIEQGAVAVTEGRDPYMVSFEDTPLGAWPPGTELHYPYLPASLIFGMPRALLGHSVLVDARIIMLAVSAAVTVAALRLARASTSAWVAVLLLLFALPTGARYAVGGGSDLPPLALMLLSLALFDRGRSTSAGVVTGIAICVKHLTLPLALCLFVAVLHRDGASAATKMLAGTVGVIAAVVVPFLAAAPGPFVEDVLLFPLGLTHDRTVAHAPTLGQAIGHLMPWPPLAVAVGLFAAFVVPITAMMLRRRDGWTTTQVAWCTSMITASVVVVATAGRLGYLIYPLNLMVWAKYVFAPRALGPDRPIPIETQPAEMPALLSS